MSRTWKWSVFVLFGLFSADAMAYCIIANSGCPQSGTGWPDSTATFHSFGFSGSSAAFDSEFPSAIRAWNGKSAFVYSSTETASDPCAGEPDSTRSWEFSPNNCGSAFGSTTLAVTATWAQGFSPTLDTIVDSDIIYNSKFNWDIHNGPGDKIDFRRVTIHESGHALGLGHDNTSATAIMDPVYDDDVETLQLDDINGLRALYGEGSDNAAEQCFPIKASNGGIVIFCI